ncbi:hypothetical protein [Sphingomonas oligophenolica]|uniref:XRE family transcriptional regulator n=1 Tax=Sphingomonas oligophenolica TaxID=301154 RepID=A0A502CL10_9SPHN|nr:hypothetical protein [Sphingomonas oligophenolica]TPG14345.1 hypothetical protein EAH84_03280 [Sphingomonas oligophenolica]
MAMGMAMVRAQPDPRVALAALARGRGEALAPLSRMLGRPSWYLGDFVRRGTPTALSIQEHRRLADYFGVDDRALGIRDLWVCDATVAA